MVISMQNLSYSSNLMYSYTKFSLSITNGFPLIFIVLFYSQTSFSLKIISVTQSTPCIKIFINEYNRRKEKNITERKLKIEFFKWLRKKKLQIVYTDFYSFNLAASLITDSARFVVLISVRRNAPWNATLSQSKLINCLIWAIFTYHWKNILNCCLMYER